MNHNKYQVKCI